MDKKRLLFPSLITVTLLMVFGALNLVYAETNSNLIVHEFEVNGKSENFTISMDEDTRVRGVVENIGDRTETIELKMNGRYHYERWEIGPGETKELESESYSHRGWYEGVFLMSLGDREIEIEVVKEGSEEKTEDRNKVEIVSFGVNGKSERSGIDKDGPVEIVANVRNNSEETVEVEITLVRYTDAVPYAQPWPYVELDVDEVRLLGHQGHYENSCSFGAFNAIIKPLQEEVGHPYTQIPTYMLHFGRGGFMGERSICGALIGATAAINLITGEEYRPLGEELLKYYKETELPTAIWDEYLEMEDSPIDPENYIAEPLGGSVANSGDCERSLENWYDETGEAQGPRRNERCGRLTGDVAAKAAELLNDWHRSRDEGTVNAKTVQGEPEFHKIYEVASGETLSIEEAFDHNWEEFERYTAKISVGALERNIDIHVKDKEERGAYSVYLVGLIILIFTAGILSGKMMKKS